MAYDQNGNTLARYIHQQTGQTRISLEKFYAEKCSLLVPQAQDSLDGPSACNPLLVCLIFLEHAYNKDSPSLLL